MTTPILIRLTETSGDPMNQNHLVLACVGVIFAFLLFTVMETHHHIGMEIVYCMEQLQDRSMETYNYCVMTTQ